MTNIIDGIHVFTYEEWSKRSDVSEMLSQSEDCPTCGGEGEHQCECGDTHECRACSGDGKTTDFREKYESLLRDELNKLLTWKSAYEASS